VLTVLPPTSLSFNFRRSKSTLEKKNEDVLYKQRCGLYRFDAETTSWKERGKGDIKFLKHRDTKAVRAVMRQEKTLKLIMNHFIQPLNELKTNGGSDKFWSWRTVDFSTEQPTTEIFGIKFRTAEIANEFKKEYDSARLLNKDRMPEEQKGDKPADKTAINKDDSKQKSEQPTPDQDAKQDPNSKSDISPKQPAS